jgi:DNA helicase-2/ATP-dependent DNA helicase PcrA
VGLENQFSIIDERDAAFIRRESVNAWLATHSLDDYFDPALESSKQEWLKREQLPNMVDSLANAFIRSAKDHLLTPESLRVKLNSCFPPLPLAELGCDIYTDYQRALAYRGAVDFDDLIRLALTLLQNDEEYLERLRFRYPFILEDEAQDSSKTQQAILGLLAGVPPEQSFSILDGQVHFTDDDALRFRTAQPETGGGNWVRVGDPNQAIFETFTTADRNLG